MDEFEFEFMLNGSGIVAMHRAERSSAVNRNSAGVGGASASYVVHDKHR